MPRLLLCDEPTGALDTNTGREVLEILQDQSRVHKKTVVMVTHNSLFAEIADIMCFIALFIYVSFDADLTGVEGALDEYYKETNFADLIVSSEGFTSEDLIEVNTIPSVSKAALRSTINGRMGLKGDEKKIEYNFIQLICDGIEFRHGQPLLSLSFISKLPLKALETF